MKFPIYLSIAFFCISCSSNKTEKSIQEAFNHLDSIIDTTSHLKSSENQFEEIDKNINALENDKSEPLDSGITMIEIDTLTYIPVSDSLLQNMDSVELEEFKKKKKIEMDNFFNSYK